MSNYSTINETANNETNSSCKNDEILCECYHGNASVMPYPYYKLFVYLDSQDDVLMDKYEVNFKSYRVPGRP